MALVSRAETCSDALEPAAWNPRQAAPVGLAHRAVQPYAMLLALLPVALIGGAVRPRENAQAILHPAPELAVIAVTCSGAPSPSGNLSSESHALAASRPCVQRSLSGSHPAQLSCMQYARTQKQQNAGDGMQCDALT